MNKIEIWKDIKYSDRGEIFDYVGIYQVSNLGRVKSFKLNKENGKIIKSKVFKGYEMVQLSVNKISKGHYIHILVAYMFLDNSYDNRYVDYINPPNISSRYKFEGDNSASNLTWVEWYDKGIYKKFIAVCKKTDKEVIFTSIHEAGRRLDVNPDGIYKCLKGKQKSTRKYKFLFIE